MKKLLILLILLAVNFSTSFADSKLYVRSKEYTPEECRPGGFKPEDDFQSNKETIKKIRDLKLDQSKFGTCFGFSGFFLVQYNEFESTGKKLALPDVLAQGCHRQFKDDGGNAIDFLQTLKNKLVATEPSYPYHYPALYEAKKNMDPGECIQTSEEISKSIKKDYQMTHDAKAYLERVARDKISYTSPETFAYDVSSEFPGIEKIRTQPFQLSYQEAESNDQFISSVQEYFKGNKEPILIRFCAKLDKTGKCIAGHAAVVSGVRKAWCNNEYKIEFQVENSYGPESTKQGWVSAIPIARASVKFKGGFLAAHRCHPKGEQRKGLPELPECNDTIQGKYPAHYLASAQDSHHLSKFLEENPESVNSVNNRGETPLLTALFADHLRGETVEVLLNKGANPNFLEKNLNLYPLDIAVVKKNPQAVRALILKGGSYSFSLEDIPHELGDVISEEYKQEKYRKGIVGTPLEADTYLLLEYLEELKWFSQLLKNASYSIFLSREYHSLIGKKEDETYLSEERQSPDWFKKMDLNLARGGKNQDLFKEMNDFSKKMTKFAAQVIERMNQTHEERKEEDPKMEEAKSVVRSLYKGTISKDYLEHRIKHLNQLISESPKIEEELKKRDTETAQEVVSKYFHWKSSRTSNEKPPEFSPYSIFGKFDKSFSSFTERSSELNKIDALNLAKQSYIKEIQSETRPIELWKKLQIKENPAELQQAFTYALYLRNDQLAFSLLEDIVRSPGFKIDSFLKKHVDLSKLPDSTEYKNILDLVNKRLFMTEKQIKERIGMLKNVD